MDKIQRLSLQVYGEGGDTDKYSDFVDKFKPKRTTDDCYTPEPVYNAVRDWVLKEVPEVRDLRIIRPFYPGGDYQSEDYEGAVVIDNPPFSILAEIKRFYIGHGVPFFLFAPSLLLFSSHIDGSTYIVADANISYANGARVRTAFISNLFGDTGIILSPELKGKIDQAQGESQALTQARYVYPPNVISAALLSKYVARGCSLRIRRREMHHTRQLDGQKKYRKTIYGTGMLVSDRVARELETFHRKNVVPDHVWELSERELGIIRHLSAGSETAPGSE